MYCYGKIEPFRENFKVLPAPTIPDGSLGVLNVSEIKKRYR
jgi:hypothetical protein